MNNQITVPQVLTDNPTFFKKINENNAKVFSHIEYIR